jgi:nucleoside-diphosphate-sugar epimerase
MSVLHQWTGNVARGEPIRAGDRTAGRDYTYVADIAAGICAILDAPKLSYEEYNNSNGQWMSLGDIVEALQQLRPGIKVVDDPNMEVGIAQSAASRAVLDVTRLREDVGFTASFDLASGLKDYLQWRETHSFYD